MPRVNTKKSKRPSIRDLCTDLRKLAEFVDWPWEDEEQPVQSFYGPSSQTKLVPAAEVIEGKWQAYLSQLREDWVKSKYNKHKPASWNQIIREAARDLGVKATGTLTDVRKACIAATPANIEVKQHGRRCSIGVELKGKDQ